jgi:hypothetical protein
MVHGLTLSPKKLLHLRALIRSLPISLIADINQSPSCNWTISQKIQKKKQNPERDAEPIVFISLKLLHLPHNNIITLKFKLKKIASKQYQDQEIKKLRSEINLKKPRSRNPQTHIENKNPERESLCCCRRSQTELCCCVMFFNF